MRTGRDGHRPASVPSPPGHLGASQAAGHARVEVRQRHVEARPEAGVEGDESGARQAGTRRYWSGSSCPRRWRAAAVPTHLPQWPGRRTLHRSRARTMLRCRPQRARGALPRYRRVRERRRGTRWDETCSMWPWWSIRRRRRHHHSDHCGFHTASHRWPSGSWKYPEYPPQNVSCAGFKIVAPAEAARAMTASTSAAEATLCPNVISVGLVGPTAIPASWAMLERGHKASRRPGCRSMNATAPYSNSLPSMPSDPSSCRARSTRPQPAPHLACARLLPRHVDPECEDLRRCAPCEQDRRHQQRQRREQLPRGHRA